MTVEEAVIERLKKSGLYEGFAAAVSKDMTAADVHKPTALGNDKKPDDEKDEKKPDAEDDKDTEFTGKIDVTKMLPEQRLIFGFASVTHINKKLVIDKQDEAIDLDHLEKAAYDFVLFSRAQGDMHDGEQHGRCVESMVFTPEKEALGIFAKNDKGESLYGWWTGFFVDSDQVWADHKAGKRPEFSIGGSAKRVPM